MRLRTDLDQSDREVEMSQRDYEDQAMDRAYDLWAQQRQALQEAHDALNRYADLKFEEYITVRDCDKMAAAGVVRDHLKFYGDRGIEVVNRLVMEKVF
jgi:multidrug resistance efflux pump